jgi:hypothetical protein
VDEQHTGDTQSADDARLLLEVLTPIAKSWPSEWCLEANSLAIQIHGGYGYTRDFPVEQYWRDNRLNMIHEGTHGIQGMDLLGRKVLMEGGRGLHCWPQRINATIGARAAPELAGTRQRAGAGAAARGRRHQSRLGHRQPSEALANAVPYMQAFGHVVLAWIWLDVALASITSQEQDATKSVASHAPVDWGLHAYFYPLRTAQDQRPGCRWWSAAT